MTTRFSNSLVALTVGFVLTACESSQVEASQELNRCCDLFSYGFCADLPEGTTVIRTDPSLGFVVHEVKIEPDIDNPQSIFIYEGNAPDIAGAAIASQLEDRALLSPEAPEAVAYYRRQNEADGQRGHLLLRTEYRWPRYIHVWFDWDNAARLAVVESVLSNISIDRSEVYWEPTCEQRQHEFIDEPMSSWFRSEVP